ncbi:hypothetical protein M413DRAFT_291440 [Hebeloma cylindrosporum]|uniref:Uncharacterized protein n=1 Tax=Hebeloma cylindrosporum TaxID=76867 RepID=A0A0C2Y5I7_HEBCY|nr:hypothetical protein M413DRAFT_291440 [Hebeloma cylindrosporum h7]
MPSYTLNNWDGSLSNSQEQTRRQSPSNTIYSRSTPIPAKKNEKSSIHGEVALNKRGDDAGGEGSTQLVKDSRNGIPYSQERGNTNLLWTQENGPTIQTTPPSSEPLRAPYLLETPRLTFTPILESPLHAHKALTRRDASQIHAVQLFQPPTTDSSPRNRLDDMDTFSIHTMDAEGEIEDEELIIVEDILVSRDCTIFIPLIDTA